MKKHWTNITEDEFINAYNSYPPNWWVRFIFKHFSKTDETKDLNINNFVTGILIGLFVVGFLGTILDWSKSVISTVTIIYAVILVFIVFSIFSAIWMNNKRIRKIADKLDVSLKEYDFLVKRFL